MPFVGCASLGKTLPLSETISSWGGTVHKDDEASGQGKGLNVSAWGRGERTPAPESIGLGPNAESLSHCGTLGVICRTGIIIAPTSWDQQVLRPGSARRGRITNHQHSTTAVNPTEGLLCFPQVPDCQNAHPEESRGGRH